MQLGDGALRNTTKVFVSYSRNDSEDVARIVDALQNFDEIELSKDTEDILPTEEWRKRLGDLIGEADAIVFCLSPDSATSEVCAWEVEFAENLNKRIAPVVIRDVDGHVPGGLAKLNYIFATEQEYFSEAIETLVTALNTDIGWVRQHTRIGELARRWAMSGEPRHQLLHGRDVDDAEHWSGNRLGNAPELTKTTTKFITSSRNETIAAARKAKRTKTLVGVLAVGGLVVSGLAYDGFFDPTYLEGRVNWVRNTMKETGLKPKDVIKECNGACPEMVVVPAGNFTMGSPKGEEERRSDEGPQQNVTIANALLVSKFEVTFNEWSACTTSGECSYQPSDNKWGRGLRPVINVSWIDVQQYLGWLRKKTGMNYRLLTEAEWEYTARAGTIGPFSFKGKISADKANYDAGYAYNGSAKGEWRQKTVPVKSFEPNAFGLYQVHGNVREWVEDCYHDSYQNMPDKTKRKGAAWTTGDCTYRVIRGGSWVKPANYLRSASRNMFLRSAIIGKPTDMGARGMIKAVDRYNYIGFRVARSLPLSG